MSDVYQIGMRLALTNGVSAVLATITAEMLKLHEHVGAIEKGFSRWNKALIGGALIGGGIGIITTLKHITDHAKELSHQLSNLKALGITDSSISSIQKQAQTIASGGGTGGGVRGTTQSGLTKLFGESYSLFGEQEARKILVPLAKFGRVFGANSHDMKKGEDQLYELIRSGELMGKFVDEKTGHVDTSKLLVYLDLAAKVGAATAGKVGPKQIFALAQQGGPALAQMSEEGLLSMFMATQDMGGHRAGTALTSLYQQMIGGVMTKDKAQRLQDLGLAPAYHVDANNRAFFDRSELARTELGKAVQSDPLKAAEIIKKHMEAHGIFGQDAQTREIFSIASRNTTQRLVSDLLRNLEQKSGERLRILGAMGLAGQYDERTMNDYIVVEDDMKKAWENLMEAIAGPNAENVIWVMRKVTDGLRSLSNTINEMNPNTLKAIAIGIAGLAAAMAVGGMVALLAALGQAGWLAAGLIAAGVAFVAFKPAFDDFIDSLKTAWERLKGPATSKSPYPGGAYGDPETSPYFDDGPQPRGEDAPRSGGRYTPYRSPLFKKTSYNDQDVETYGGMYEAVKRALLDVFFGGAANSGGSGAFGGGASIYNASLGGADNDNYSSGGSAGTGTGAIGGTGSGRGGSGGGGSSVNLGELRGKLTDPGSYGFKGIHGELVARLMKDDNLTAIQAAGVVGSLGHESGNFRAFHEGGQREGRGGYGWAQWTGPRRIAFLNWARENKLDPRSFAANYAYLHADPQWRKTAANLRRQSTLGGAMHSFEHDFEGAGIKAFGSRMGHANRALREYNGRSRDAITKGVAPAPKKQSGPPVMFEAHLDGDVLTKHVSRRQTAAARHPNASGGPDTYGNHYDSGSRFSDVG